MRVKRLGCLMLALVLVLGLCACDFVKPSEGEQTAAAPEGGETVTDMIGRTVTVEPGSYKRVVCVGAGALRMYSYIGDVNALCGVEDIDNVTLEERPAMFDGTARPYVLAYGDVFSKLPSCGVGGPMAQAAEAEKILSCEPDIVISEFEDVQKADALQKQLGVPVITLRSGPEGVFGEEFAGSLELLGTVFGKEDRAQELIGFVNDQAEAISQRTVNIAEEDKPNVYVCGLGNWGTTDHLTTAEEYAPFRVANINNVLRDVGMEGIGPIEEEKFIELGDQMHIMILDAAAVKNIKPLYQEDPTLFDECKAWQDGQVYLEMAYNAYYTNYEIALINTWFMAKSVYPEFYEDVDMTEKTNEITKMFLGQELAEEIFSCPSSFGGYQRVKAETLFG